MHRHALGIQRRRPSADLGKQAVLPGGDGHSESSQVGTTI